VLKKKEGKARFGLTMSRELFERINTERGLIPRATYIEHCLKQYFKFLDSSKQFYDEILAMLPEKVTGEDCDKLRKIAENVRSKILDRRKLIQVK